MATFAMIWDLFCGPKLSLVRPLCPLHSPLCGMRMLNAIIACKTGAALSCVCYAHRPPHAGRWCVCYAHRPPHAGRWCACSENSVNKKGLENWTRLQLANNQHKAVSGRRQL